MFVSVELNDIEGLMLEAMADELDMEQYQILRHALILYQQQFIGRKLGYQYVTRDTDGTILEDKVYGCPALD